MPLPNFDDLLSEFDLRLLTTEERNAVLRFIHAFGSAHAKRIAYSDDYLLVEGGNLEYYAGLEYDPPIMATPLFKLYEASPSYVGENDAEWTNVDDVVRKCRAVVEGVEA